MESLSRLRATLAEQSLPALLVTQMLNVRWLTGFTGSSGAVVVTADRAVFITDSRYAVQAHEEVEGFEIIIFRTPSTLDGEIMGVLREGGLTECGFETSITYAAWEKRTQDAGEFHWRPVKDLCEGLRKIKSAAEIRRIQAACQLADACMEHVSRMLQPGISEYDIALDLEFYYRRHGAAPSFSSIVVSGVNSARPHGQPGSKLLERGDFVTIDCGALLDGYCSDITRTFVIGEASDRHREVYGEVLRAQVAAIEAMHPGTPGKDVDGVARAILKEKDYEQYFGHGLGHGLGLAVHDPGSLSMSSPDILAPGMVLTVEPGVYIDGFGGVRIEDDVLVTETGPQVLTHFPKELTIT